MKPVNERELLTVDEAADYLGLSRSTLYQYASARILPSYKLGRLLRFDRRDLDSWIASRRVESV